MSFKLKKCKLNTCQIGKNSKVCNTFFWQGRGEVGTLRYCWWEYRYVPAFWNALWQYLTKLHMQLSFDLVIPLLQIYPEDIQNIYEGGYS